MFRPPLVSVSDKLQFVDRAQTLRQTEVCRTIEFETPPVYDNY